MKFACLLKIYYSSSSQNSEVHVVSVVSASQVRASAMLLLFTSY